MFEHLFESSHRDDSYKWSNVGFVEGITQVEFTEVYSTYLILSSALMVSKVYPFCVILVHVDPAFYVCISDFRHPQKSSTYDDRPTLQKEILHFQIVQEIAVSNPPLFKLFKK